MASIQTPPSLAPARWRACERACRFTLHWPIRPSACGPDQEIGPWDGRLAMATSPHSANSATSATSAAVLPPLPLPAHCLLALSGEAGLRRLVHRHMARLRLTPLLDRAGDCFDCVAERVGDFVVERCGGPLLYSERHARLLAGAGGPVLLDEAGRDLWLVQLWHAMEDVGMPWALRAEFWHWAEPLSVHLMAPRARQTLPRRYPFTQVRAWFHAPDGLG